MCFVDTGVDRLESGFGFRAFYMATDAVFAFSEGDDLAEVESVFQNDKIATAGFSSGSGLVPKESEYWLVSVFSSYADLKLFAAGRAFKHEGASGSVQRVVEQYGFVAFRTTYFFHGAMSNERSRAKSQKAAQGSVVILL